MTTEIQRSTQDLLTLWVWKIQNKIIRYERQIIVKIKSKFVFKAQMNQIRDQRSWWNLILPSFINVHKVKISWFKSFSFISSSPIFFSKNFLSHFYNNDDSNAHLTFNKISFFHFLNYNLNVRDKDIKNMFWQCDAIGI